MMTLAPIRSSEHAATYFERGDHADYYLADEACPSAWLGEGAKLLGIAGQAVEPERFKHFLAGDVAGQWIGTERSGEWQHKPGWDLQFSPPKSVTTMALGDPRIRELHIEAVNAAIHHLQMKAAYTRVHSRDPCGRDQYKEVLTGNLLVAAFLHNTSRAVGDAVPNPQLHTHAVVLNATHRADGQWRSLNSRHFYVLQKELGIVYRQALSSSLRSLGYGIAQSGDGSFEVAGIPDALLDAFSERRNAIDEELKKQGLTRENASASQKERIAHDSRSRKKTVDRTALHGHWASIMVRHGFDIERHVANALNCSRSIHWQAEKVAQDKQNLGALLDTTVRALSEREAVFSETQLREELNSRAVGLGLSAQQVSQAIETARANGTLIGGREVPYFDRQFARWTSVEGVTTPQNIKREQAMLCAFERCNRRVRPGFTPDDIRRRIESAERESVSAGFSEWNAGQKQAVTEILSSSRAVTGLQGLAGTAKTSTAIQTIVRSYREQGYAIRAMAPSASACESLAEGARINQVVTVDSFLYESMSRQAQSDKVGKQLWVVDEASLLSTQKMGQLLDRAASNGARVMLVGDTGQLGSVESGAAFRQLRECGMVTSCLSDIVRQDNPYLLDAVYQAVDGEIDRAFSLLNEGGGAVVEVPGGSEERYELIVERYLALSPSERKKTLLIDPSREGREKLNTRLREALRLVGDIGSAEVKLQRLESLDMTRADMVDVTSYRQGDSVRFFRDYKRCGVEAGSYWKVDRVEPGDGVVILANDRGRSVVWNPSVWGLKSQVFRPVGCTLSVGDMVRWTINAKSMGLVNGSRGTVTRIDSDSRTAQILFSSGRQITASLDNISSQHWAYDYASTVHAAQGRTADRVLFHAESFRHNLASQKAFYVAVSRAREEATIFTDSKARLVECVAANRGEKQNALEIDSFAYGREM